MTLFKDMGEKTYEVYGYLDGKLMFIEGTVDEASVNDLVVDAEEQGYVVQVFEQK